MRRETCRLECRIIRLLSGIGRFFLLYGLFGGEYLAGGFVGAVRGFVRDVDQDNQQCGYDYVDAVFLADYAVDGWGRCQVRRQLL